MRRAGWRKSALARGLNTPGLLRILLERAPQLLEAGFAAAAGPGSQKHITKGLILTHLFERDGLANCPRI